MLRVFAAGNTTHGDPFRPVFLPALGDGIRAAGLGWNLRKRRPRRGGFPVFRTRVKKFCASEYCMYSKRYEQRKGLKVGTFGNRGRYWIRAATYPTASTYSRAELFVRPSPERPHCNCWFADDRRQS